MSALKLPAADAAGWVTGQNLRVPTAKQAAPPLPFNDFMLRSCLYPRKALPKRMRLCYLSLIGLLGSGFSATADSNPPIDRHALVTRHDIDWPNLNGQIPLGNGNFAFNADGIGLETVGGNTMCHWCWHSFPLPPGVTKNDIKPWATPHQIGR